MNSYPKNLCIVPFIHLSSRADGATQLCCRAYKVIEDRSKKNLSLGYNSLDEIWNGEEIKEVRRLMLANKKLSECEKCWHEEKNGKQSKRMKENHSFLKENKHRLKEAKNNHGFLSTPPFSLELKLGNLCNLKCRICNPLTSSLWKKELERHEKQWKSSAVLKSLYESSFNLSKQLTKWHETELFFENIKKVAPVLKLIQITGGEPLLIKSLSQTLDFLIKTKVNKNIKLSISSNTTVFKSDFFDKINQFKAVYFGASIDATGEKNNWMRPPSHFSKIEKNIKKILSLTGPINLEIDCAVSAYNVLCLPELIKWSKTFSPPPPPIFFNLVTAPDFQHISVLTADLKKQTIKRIQDIKNTANLYKSEIEDLNSICNILSCSLEDTEKTIKLRQSLKEHTKTLDHLRKENFYKTFPELSNLFA